MCTYKALNIFRFSRTYGRSSHQTRKCGQTQSRTVIGRPMHDFQEQCQAVLFTAVASMRRTEALASVKFYQILSIFIFFIRLIILEDFIRLISYNGPCVRLGCSFFLATALLFVMVCLSLLSSKKSCL